MQEAAMKHYIQPVFTLLVIIGLLLSTGCFLLNQPGEITPPPTEEKPPEEESLSLREYMQNLVAKSQQALKRDSDSSKDQSETELDD